MSLITPLDSGLSAAECALRPPTNRLHPSIFVHFSFSTFYDNFVLQVLLIVCEFCKDLIVSLCDLAACAEFKKVSLNIFKTFRHSLVGMKLGYEMLEH